MFYSTDCCDTQHNSYNFYLASGFKIDAQKNYKIEATPTVIINDKKYSGKVDYLKFKKEIEKNLKKYE